MICNSRYWIKFIGSRVLVIALIMLLITVDLELGPFGYMV